MDKTPLHITTLAQLELVFRACAQITFYAVSLLGRTECLKAAEIANDVQTLRFLTPIAKAFVCKIGVQAISEAMEALGGQGYMEEVGIARHLRDSQVNTIWEGTTNVLAMDVLRVLRQTKNKAFDHFEQVLLAKLNAYNNKDLPPTLRSAQTHVKRALINIRVFLETTSQQPETVDASARELTFALGRALGGALLIEHAAWALQNKVPGTEQHVLAASCWCQHPELIREIPVKTALHIENEAKLVFGADAKL